MSSANDSSEKPSAPSAADLEAALAQFVDAAFTEAEQGQQGRAYQTLIAQFNTSISLRDSAACLRWLTAISGVHAPRIAANTQKFSDLLNLLWKLDYELFGVAAARVYCELIVVLASGAAFHTNILSDSFRALIRAFRKSGTDPAEDAATATDQVLPDVPANPDVKEPTEGEMAHIHDYCHNAILRILRISPSSLTLVFTRLVDMFPHTRLSTLSWLAYVKNLLRFAETLPSMREKILTLIIERIILVDVEAGGQQHSLPPSSQISRSITSFSDEEHVDGNGTPDSSMTMFEQSVIESDEAKKLDSVIRLVLDYLRLVASPGSSSVNSLNQDVFSCLLRVFDRSIVPTHSIHCTQFLMFYYCSLRHQFTESYLLWMFERIKDESQLNQTRISSAAYFASFIARAPFIRADSVLHFFGQLLEFTVQQVDLTQALRQQSSLDPDAYVSQIEAKQYEFFYRLVQCVLYIMIYRASLLESRLLENESMRDSLRVYLHDMLDNSLQPLTYCDRLIVDEFKRCGRLLDVIDVGPILKRQALRPNNQAAANGANGNSAESEWNRWKLSQSHSSLNNGAGLLGLSTLNQQSINQNAGQAEASNVNDRRFPFDPWFLPEFGRFVQPQYSFYSPFMHSSMLSIVVNDHSMMDSPKSGSKKRKDISPVVGPISPPLWASHDDHDSDGDDDTAESLVLIDSPGFGPLRQPHKQMPGSSSRANTATNTSRSQVTHSPDDDGSSDLDGWLTPMSLPTALVSAHLSNSVEALTMSSSDSVQTLGNFDLSPAAVATTPTHGRSVFTGMR